MNGVFCNHGYMSRVVKVNYSVDECAFALGVSASTVRKFAREDPTFPCQREGKRILIHIAKLEEWNNARVDKSADT
jgi:predicted transcriptional regulator